MNAQHRKIAPCFSALKTLVFSITAFGLLATGRAEEKPTRTEPLKSTRPTPALTALPKFTGADVPESGPEEIPIDPPKYTVDEPAHDLPGKGLAAHSMLYIGEGCNKMFLVDKGKVIWTYSTGNGWEYDDIWMLSNGNILFSRMAYAAEITPQKKVVWRLDPPKGSEIHSVQPIGLDKVFVVQNGTPARIMIIDTKSGKVEMNHELSPEITGTAVHGQFRRGRLTSEGTCLLACLQKHKVVEYDKDFKEIWSYSTPQPWAAIRLKNGNTLITDEKEAVTSEVNRKGEIVWKFDLHTDLPPELAFSQSQSCVRLANGNTIFCSRAKPGKGPQLVEVTPEKKVVWALDDWKDLGPATAIQILDDPGVPENPGECQR